MPEGLRASGARLFFLAVAIFVIAIAGWAMITPIQKGKFLPKLAPWLNFFFPPRDLYEPLLLLDVNLEVPSEARGVFAVKYAGAHSFGLYAHKMPALSGDGYNGKVSMSVVMKTGDRVVIESEGGGVTPFWEVGGRGGFEIGRFSAPMSVPVDEELECVVSIRVADLWFVETYGPFRFYISKAADE